MSPADIAALGTLVVLVLIVAIALTGGGRE